MKLFLLCRIRYLLALGTLTAGMLLTSCNDWNNVPNFDVEQVEGYRPIYASETEIEVVVTAPRSLVQAGKIYVLDDYLLVVEPLKGIHIINNEDPKSPKNIGFLQLAGTNDVAIRDNILYADRWTDLIAIDISNLNAIKVVSTIKGVFPFAQRYPEIQGTYFECPNPAKGIVVAWEKVTLNQPKCYH